MVVRRLQKKAEQNAYHSRGIEPGNHQREALNRDGVKASFQGDAQMIDRTTLKALATVEAARFCVALAQ
jgi:hypothetical protein